MNTRANKELIRSTAVAIGAWLIVIAAGVNERLDGPAAVVPIVYMAE